MKTKLLTLIAFIGICTNAIAQYNPTFKQEITITNDSSASFDDYQIYLTINTAAIVIAGNMQTDGDDIRFSPENTCDPTTFYNYFIESGMNSSTTKIWVKIPAFASSTSYTLYMYYGDAAAIAGSNFAATFPAAVITAGGGAGSFTGTGTLTYDWFELSGGDILSTTAGDNTLTIIARNIIINGQINGNGLGYQIPGTLSIAGTGPGAGGTSTPSTTSGAGGAGYGNSGGVGCSDAGDVPGVGGVAYGTSSADDVDMGSSGGSSDNTLGGNGGGLVKLVAEVVQNNGTINMNGNDGAQPGGSRGGGAGAGGCVYIITGELVNNGTITAVGGHGSDGTASANDGGGGGAGGRIKLFYETNPAAGTTTVTGGTPGINGSVPGGSGGAGTVYSGVRPMDGIVVLGSQSSVSSGSIDASFTVSGPFCSNDNIEIDLVPTVAGGTFSGPGIVNNGSTGSASLSGTPVAITDNLPAGINSTITPSGIAGTAIGTDQFLTSVCFAATHTWVGDLKATLTSPNGTTVVLFDRPGVPATTFGCSGNNLNVTFVPGTGTEMETTCNVTAPAISGTFNAFGGTNLNSLNDGSNPNGNWVLNISDNAVGDIGTITGFTLNFGTNGTFNPSLSGAGTHTYTYTLFNCAGCSNSSIESVIVNNPPVVTITPGGPTTFCQGGSVVLTASSGSSYSWAPGGETTQAITASNAGSYTVSVTDGNGCSGTSAATIITFTPNTPVSFTGLTAPFCSNNNSLMTLVPSLYGGTFSGPGVVNNGSATTIPIGGLPVPITDNLPAGDQYTIDLTGLVPGTSLGTDIFLGSICFQATHTWVGDLRFTVTSPNGTTVVLFDRPGVPATTFGCSGNDINVTFIPGTGTEMEGVCNGTVPTISGSFNAFGGANLNSLNDGSDPNGVWTINISDNAATDLGSFTGLTFNFGTNGTFNTSIAGAGAHTIDYDFSNCAGCLSSSSQIVTVNAPPATPTISGIASFCTGGSTTLTSSSATGNVWSPGGATTQALTVTSGGSYTVTVTDGNSCSATSLTTTVTVNSLPATPTISGTASFCTGGSTVLSSSSATGNVWAPGGATTQDLTVTAGGSYTVTVTNGNGCSATSLTTTVTVNSLPATPTISGTTSFCTGGSTVLSSSSATGNVWAPGGGATQDLTVTAGGSYTVTVTNGNGCSATSTSTTVTVNPLPATPTISGTASFCTGGSTTLSSSSATGNVWSPGGATSQALTVTSGGSYSVTVTNGNGCSATSSATTVTVNSLPATPTITPSGATTFCDPGSVDLTSSSATGNVWSPGGATTQTMTASASGSYSVTVTDGNGCVSASSSATSVTEEICIGVNESAMVNSLNIFPNPASESLNIEFTSDEVTCLEVRMTNTMGQLIYSDVITTFSGTYKNTFSVIGFATGNYTLQVITDKAMVNKKVIIK